MYFYFNDRERANNVKKKFYLHLYNVSYRKKNAIHELLSLLLKFESRKIPAVQIAFGLNVRLIKVTHPISKIG